MEVISSLFSRVTCCILPVDVYLVSEEIVADHRSNSVGRLVSCLRLVYNRGEMLA